MPTVRPTASAILLPLAEPTVAGEFVGVEVVMLELDVLVGGVNGGSDIEGGSV